MPGTYAYVDRGDGLALCQVKPGRVCWTFTTNEGLSIRKHPLQPVPKRFLQARRAPSVLWKPGADPDVVNATDVEMIDLVGAGSFGAPGELEAADQVFMLVGGGVLIGILSFAAMLMSKEPREVGWVRD